MPHRVHHVAPPDSEMNALKGMEDVHADKNANGGLNYVISKNILLICQKTSLQLPVDIFPYLNGGYATDNIAKITP